MQADTSKRLTSSVRKGELVARERVFVSKSDHQNESAADQYSGEAKPITNFESGLSFSRHELSKAGATQNFTGSRVIRSSESARLSQRMGADAFTWNNQIYLGSGFEQRSDREQKHILQHERAHIEQNKQVNNSHVIQRSLWGAATSLLGAAKDWALEKIVGPLRENEDYRLMTGVVGKDLFTGEAVQMEPKEFVQAAFRKAGQDEYFQALDESGVFPKFFTWFTNRFKEMNLSWAYFKGIIDRVLSLDLIGLGVRGSIAEFWNIMSEPVTKIVTFLRDVGKKVAELILDSFLISPAGQWLKRFLQKASVVYRAIFTTPIEFFRNVFSSLKLGFQQFIRNILRHLLSGVLDWLLGSLKEDGAELQQPLSITSVVLFALGVIGISYQNFRKILVAEIAKNEKDKDGADERAERKMQLLEESFELVQAYKERGIVGVWEYLKEKIMEAFTDLKESIMEEIRNFLITKIVTIAVEKVIAMLVPAAAVLSAIKTGVDMLFVIIDQIANALRIIEGIFDAIIEIASGALGRAASFVEGVLARAIPIAIAFLAGLLGLGGIPRKIKEILMKVKKQVDKALQVLAKMFFKLAGPVLELMAKAVETVDGVIEGIKGFVGGLLHKEKFKIADEDHSFELVANETEVQLIMRSNPKRFLDLMTELQTKVDADESLKEKNGPIKSELSTMRQEAEKIEQDVQKEILAKPEDKAKAVKKANTKITALILKLREQASALGFEHLINNTALGEALDDITGFSDRNYLRFTEKVKTITQETSKILSDLGLVLSKNYSNEAEKIETETLDKWREENGETKNSRSHMNSKIQRSKNLIDQLLIELAEKGIGLDKLPKTVDAEGVASATTIKLVESSLEDLEGDVAPYKTNSSKNTSHNSKFRNLILEADHSPQGSILKLVPNFRIKRTGEEQPALDNGKTPTDLYNSGLSMNLARHRHSKTRSYLSGASGVITEFFSELNSKIKSSFGSRIAKNKELSNSNYILEIKETNGYTMEDERSLYKRQIKRQLQHTGQKDQEHIRNNILSLTWCISSQHKAKIEAGSREIYNQNFSEID